MQIIQMCCSVVVGFIGPLLVAAQAMPAAPAPIADPPRQEMQTVVPNLREGPYLVNVTGKTFVSDVFLDVVVSEINGQAVPEGTTVTFDAVPETSGDSIPVSGQVVNLTALTTAGHAKFVPDIAANGDWLMTWSVAGPAGDGTMTPQRVGIDPHRPPVSTAYRLSQIALPIVTAVLLLALFQLRRVELEQWPLGRGQTKHAPELHSREAVG
jgi:hypothetical protein